ncbi:Fe-S cluster assembly iron-binding protein IscA [Asanoa hainanensis]|uniref:Fe-S cluster assembly iron-binding protein IscA n=1 Tax=Asanoa hainanensis TaxID=560556 RepID=A0A239PEK4_9ACTN|nr:hypothetical protein [Asanoa hainanensis]SNT65516.1 Fe-S cluster assembly iron-binding protein IscA [Asanoa hainanensis]
MVTITDQALSAISVLLAQDGVPAGTGLRISTDPHRRLRLSFTPQPRAGDSVIDRDGARVFVEPDAAQALLGRALDAEAGGTSGVHFAVCRQFDTGPPVVPSFPP